MTFSVGSSSTDKKLEGVAVLVAGSGGKLAIVGHTDAGGKLSIPRHLLRQPGNTALLFCKERFFCGAFRLDDDKFFEADYRLIQLAPFAVP